MNSILLCVLVAPLAIGAYAYVLYPALLWLLTLPRKPRAVADNSFPWPAVTITVPVYNSAAGIERTLTRLLDLDYPRDRLQILVLSDASTDGTDDVVRRFATQGVELWRAPERRGKTAAENAAVTLARGEVIVNVDATITVPRGSLKRLVSAFSDPMVGVASGRDVSVAAGELPAGGEAKYTGYEMWLRELETRAGSIVGASGCFFAIRKEVHAEPLPPELSWDFASSLVAKTLGFRSVSVSDAICVVPRTAEVQTELRRKSRTMARGLSTLFYFRRLMNPARYGGFALMLISHKLLRWLPYLLTPFALLALLGLATSNPLAAEGVALALTGLVAGIAGMRSKRAARWKPLALTGFVVAALSAGFLAWFNALRGVQMVTWNPTPRPNASAA
jgi:cellulose synthase/poly-beta-1,6-N-acetylglucosamine synthase-like glycosyltransferase